MCCVARFGKPATLLKLILLHGCFSRFLNCTNGTKWSNASHISIISESANSSILQMNWLTAQYMGKLNLNGSKYLVKNTWSFYNHLTGPLYNYSTTIQRCPPTGVMKVLTFAKLNNRKVYFGTAILKTLHIVPLEANRFRKMLRNHFW